MAEQAERKELSHEDRLLEIRSLAIEAGPSHAASKILDHVDVLLGRKTPEEADQPRGTATV